MPVKGVLLDLEGVLYQEGAAIAGATEALAELHQQGLDIRFLTNTTTQPRSHIVARLISYGIETRAEQLFTPAIAARGLLESQGCRRIHLAAPPGLAEDFDGFELVARDAQAVVLGDLHLGFTWERLNELFTMVLNGARLIALHRNRYCTRDGRIALDLGPFVAALEYACGFEASVVGKPDRDFFLLAVEDLSLPAEAVVMVGDDLEADIGGAQRAGVKAIQVETGKFRRSDRDQTTIRPDSRIASIADLPGILARWGAGAP